MCRAIVEQTVGQLDSLKQHWADKLEEMGVRVETAVKQQVSQEEILQLRSKLSAFEEQYVLQCLNACRQCFCSQN